MGGAKMLIIRKSRLRMVSSFEDHGPEIPAVVVNQGFSYTEERKIGLSFPNRVFYSSEVIPHRTAYLVSSATVCRPSLFMILTAVRFHGLDADVEPVGDLLCGAPFDDELQHFALTQGQVRRQGMIVVN